MTWRHTLTITILFLVIPMAGPSFAAEPDCHKDTDLERASNTCQQSAEEIREAYRQGPTSNFRYRLVPRCHVDLVSDDCYRPIACDSPPDTDSFEVHRARLDVEPPVWESYGQVCLGSPEEITQEISAADVAREFQRLTWPQANLRIQPPDGETLVNLATVFHTPDTNPVTQIVTLLGQTVEIEATPTSWTWHWAQPDDNAADTSHQPHTTDDPGAAYPHGTITHAYRHADTTVHPSLDVTYTGRFRVGTGNWEDIPETHTVTGTPQPLTVLQAQPGLVR